MLTFRCTKRLLDRLPMALEAPPPHSTTLLGDWYANVIFIDRKPVVLCAAKRTLLPVLLPLAPAQTLAKRLHVALAEVLGALHVPRAIIDAEAKEMSKVVVAKTDDRAVVGTLVDFAHMIEMYTSADRSLTTLALDLAETPCSVLGMGSPRRATLALIAH